MHRPDWERSAHRNAIVDAQRQLGCNAQTFSIITFAPSAGFVPTTDTSRGLPGGPDGRAIKALVVDDEETLSELVGLALRFEGLDIRLASDGRSAITAAANSDQTW